MRFSVLTPLPALAALAAALGTLATGCRDQTPIPHTPTTIVVVAGANQSGNVSSPLDSALVVQVRDGAGRSVAGVKLTWTVLGGGTLSATSTTTDNDGKSTVTWTLAPTAGTQVVTVTSTQISGAAISFVANNGATISGTVTAAGGSSPFSPTFARFASRSARFGLQRTVMRRLSVNRIVVGFKNDMLGVPRAGSGVYRSVSVARDAMSRLQQRVAAISAAQSVSHAELSPAMLAARLRVDDTTQVEAVLAGLRNDPNVAWAERDAIVSIRDGAPQPMSTDFLPSFVSQPVGGVASAGMSLPNDPAYFEQAWPANMLDLPRAWSITTGSANIIVAVVDMGVRFDHPNAAPNLTSDGYSFVSHVGYGSTQNICGGGTFDTIDGPGYNGPTSDPTDPDDLIFDSANNCWARTTLGDHGLWTSGIIGAAGNQGLGMAGVNWTVKIRPVRVLGITGDGTTFDIAQGVLYAAGLPAVGANNGLVTARSAAPIINLSLGGPLRDSTLGSAIAAASNAGSLIVASAGNDGLDLPTYPAGYPNVMAVAAVGMDGVLATYSNAGTNLSVAAPGGDFRLDDNGGGGILGPGWDFVHHRPIYLFGYGTSASAPYVSGVAALLLAANPSLTAAQLRSRIEQYATRVQGVSRSDTYGWGIVNAYNALAQQNGPTRQTYARLLDATTGLPTKTVKVNADGGFVFTRLSAGAYLLQAGDDEGGDATIGVPGRRFAWAGGFGSPTVFNINGNSQSAAIVLGTPIEAEPNDDVAHANFLSVGSYVVGSITSPDPRDVFSVNISVTDTYTFETSGVVGSCGLGTELDTYLSVANSAGAVVGANDNFTSPTGRFCSKVTAHLSPGIYYVTVTPSPGPGAVNTRGRYRLEVREGS